MQIDGETPDTFLKAAEPTDAGELDEADDLLRIEGLIWPLEQDSGHRARTDHAEILDHFEKLRQAWEDSGPDGNAFVDRFLEKWNRQRSEHPAFATFLGSVIDDADAPDWQYRLRDRLGLAHYQPAPGFPIPVAKMVYTVKEVRKEVRPDAVPFTCPTVLDSRPWEYYFPAPREIRYGRAMALRTDGDEEDLQPEVLHTRVTYQRKHIKGLALIERPWGPQELKELRNHHLLRIRMALLNEPAAAGRPEFGEDMP